VNTPLAGDFRSALTTRIVIGVLAAVLVTLFALGGPTGPLAIVAVGLTAALGMALLPDLSPTVLLPLLGIALLTEQVTAGVHVFDGIALALVGLAVIVTLRSGDRRAWEIHGPGALALAALAVPLAALPFTVVSVSSYLGGYKELALPVLLFLSLRRLVRREDSRILLWVFPLVGTTAAVQLLMHTHGLDARLYERLDLRNLYANLGWGWSDYIAALVEMCLLFTILLGVLDRRWGVRVVLAGCALLMLQAFLMLFSRAGTLSLALAGLIIALGWGGRRGVAVILTLVGLAGAGLATPGGRVIAERFVTPREFGSYYTRLIVWQQAWDRFLAHPLTGIGLNQGRYQSDAMGDSRGHNPMLDALMDQGILGGIFLAFLVVVIYRLCRRAEPAGVAASPRTVRVVLIAVVTGILAHACVEPTLSGYAMAFLFAWFLAWLSLQDPRGLSAGGGDSTPALRSAVR
jgi:O-antigen ligase